MRPTHMMVLMALAALAPATQAPAANLSLAAAPQQPPKFPTLGAVGDGRRFFLRYNCYGCHGNNAGGQIGPNIQHIPADIVYDAVINGQPQAGMPSFSRFASVTDVANIAAYLDSIGTVDEPKWQEWWRPFPPK